METGRERAHIAQDVLEICKAELINDLRAQLREEMRTMRAEQERWRSVLRTDLQKTIHRLFEAAAGSDGAAPSITSPPVFPSEDSSVFRVPLAPSLSTRTLSISGAVNGLSATASRSLQRAGTMSKQAMQPQINREISWEVQRAERLGRTLPCLIRSLRCVGSVLLVLFMVFFFSWGTYKIFQPQKYVEIRTETFPWKGGPEKLPQMAFDRLDDQTIEVQNCTIENGDRGTKRCQKVHTFGCQMNTPVDIECLPTLEVEGTFGDSRYTYVVIRDYVRGGELQNSLSFRWKQRESLSWTGVNAQFYTSVKDVPMRSELYFQKVTALQGEVFGLFGRTGNDETEYLLHKEIYMVKATEYSYVGRGNETNANGETLGRSLYLRATKTEREDFHEVYSIMKLLEALGGLYTSLSFILFIPLVMASKTLRYSGQLLGFTRRDVLNPAQAVVSTALTQAPLEGGMRHFTEQSCEGSPEPEAGRVSPEPARFMEL